MRKKKKIFLLFFIFTLVFSIEIIYAYIKNEQYEQLLETFISQKDKIFGLKVTSKDGELEFKVIGRFQAYQPSLSHPMDVYDKEILSPKSVKFHPYLSKVYVNALEGSFTLIFDPLKKQRIGIIRHQFEPKHAHLFAPDQPFDYVFFTSLKNKREVFSGKPVEMTFTHKGRYLWISYYRRSFDPCGCNPSAVALIDTERDEIIRVFSVGPIPKWIVASPDELWLAIVHWGDNTVGLIDIRGSDPNSFRLGPLITIGNRQNLKEYLARVQRGESINRDRECGLCLRGAVFTPEGRYLLVGLMAGGGIAVIDMSHQRFLGIAQGIKPTPRHLVISPDNHWLYVSSSISGYITKFSINMIKSWIESSCWEWKPLSEVYVGRFPRTIALSPDGRYLYTAVYGDAKVVVLRTDDLQKIAEIPVAPYPVGLDVSSDGRQVWITSQGWRGKGGKSVTLIEVEPVQKFKKS